MTINQIKMLTTSCKNYKSLKQCVIEKGEAERRSGRKGELQTLIKVNGKLNYFVPLWVICRGHLRSYGTKRLKVSLAAKLENSFQVTLATKWNWVPAWFKQPERRDHTRSDTWKKGRLHLLRFYFALFFCLRSLSGLKFSRKKLLMYGTIIVQGKWKSGRNGVETVRC